LENASAGPPAHAATTRIPENMSIQINLYAV